MSGRPLVPSKDALRTLRHLALSSPIASLGTAGALCGIVTLHYHENQKVRLAERILERKRALHAVSNGRGALRLARMFEAAENGEDFTLKKSTTSRASGRRRHSAVATRSKGESGGSPRDNTSEDTTHETPIDPDQTDAQPPTIYSIHADARRNRPTSRSNMLHTWGAIAKVVSTSRQAFRDQPLPHDPVTVSPEFDSASSTQQSDQVTATQPTQPTSDLNPLHTPRNTSTAEAVSPERSNVPDLDGFYNRGTNVFSTMQPWHIRDEIEATSVQEFVDLDRKRNIGYHLRMNLYVPFGAIPPPSKYQHTYPSQYDQISYGVKNAMKLVGTRRYNYVFHTLAKYRRTQKMHDFIELFERTLKLYIATGKPQDWYLAQALFLDCLKMFPSHTIRHVVVRLVQHFLHGDTPRLEVVGLLYPLCGAGKIRHSYDAHYMAAQYMELVIKRANDLDEVMTELRKLLAGAQRCGIEPDQLVVVPIMRWLYGTGRATQAQAIYEEMRNVYKMKFSFLVITELVKGLARVGNWAKVKYILDDGHQQNLSSSRLYGFSSLLTSVLDAFTATHSVDQTYEFVLHCLREYGVQPLTILSRKMIPLALRHRRYDLVAAWIDMIMTRYPHLNTGTGTSTFAFDVSSVWAEMGANCEDILLGSKAIATNAIRDPFSPVFRAIASEAASNYIMGQSLELREEYGLDVFPRGWKTMDNLSEAVQTMKQILDAKEPGSRIKLHLNELLSQVEALASLNALFRGEVGADEQRPSPDFDSAKWSPKNTDDGLGQLASVEDVTSEILAHYEHRSRLGLPVEHDHLQETVALLVQKNRPFDAVSLIESVYKSRWASPPAGREFDLELFVEWLEISWRLRSGSRLRSALWALVESGPHIKVTSRIILLSRISAPKTHFSRFRLARESEFEEVEYLRQRLRQRRFLQPQPNRFMFDMWSGLSKQVYEENSTGISAWRPMS